MQQTYLAAFTAKAQADARLRAAWLEGSFGRGNADRYADLDLHLLVQPAELEALRQEIQAWLEALRPLVLFTWLFDRRMVNALANDGLRIDLWLHDDAVKTVDPQRARVLFAQEGALHFVTTTSTPNPAATAAHLERQIKEFWRCIALTPAVIGRGELITGFMGLMVEVNLLTDLLITGHGIVRERGVKNLNHYLPAGAQRRIEAALDLPGLSPASLIAAHWGLAQIVQETGPALAVQHGFPYPRQLEAVVLRYVEDELTRLGYTLP